MVTLVFCVQLYAGTSTKIFRLPRNAQSFIKTFSVERKGDALFSVQQWLTARRDVGRLKEMIPVIFITESIKKSSEEFLHGFVHPDVYLPARRGRKQVLLLNACGNEREWDLVLFSQNPMTRYLQRGAVSLSAEPRARKQMPGAGGGAVFHPT